MSDKNRRLLEPIHLTEPYDITIRSGDEAADYVMNQCSNCPRYAANWDCSGRQTYKCKLIAYQVVQEVKNQTKTYHNTDFCL